MNSRYAPALAPENRNETFSTGIDIRPILRGGAWVNEISTVALPGAGLRGNKDFVDQHQLYQLGWKVETIDDAQHGGAVRHVQGQFVALALLAIGCVFLDRYGPRRVVASLLCVAALGALEFALANSFGELTLGRALVGLGVSACLMGSIKAFTLWFPLARLATLNGWTIAFGGLGSLAATSPRSLRSPSTSCPRRCPCS